MTKHDEMAKSFHEAHGAIRRNALRLRHRKRRMAVAWSLLGVAWTVALFVVAENPTWWFLVWLLVGPIYILENWRYVSGHDARENVGFVERMEALYEDDYGPRPS